MERSVIRGSIPHYAALHAGYKKTNGPPRRAVRERADEAWSYFLAPMPANFFWKRDTRPPRSSRFCWPPVQAGCAFGSMSSASVSPGLPQVVRVVNSVPWVILTGTGGEVGVLSGL